MKLKPKCLMNQIQMALTNRGELLPCCYCDQEVVLKDPKIKKLLSVSQISDVESVEEILLSKEWIEFAKNLEKNIAPKVCFQICGDRKESSKIETYIDQGKEVHINKV